MAMFETLDNEYFKTRIKVLEEENATLKETIRQLREQLYKHTQPRRSHRDDYDYLPYEEDDRS